MQRKIETRIQRTLNHTPGKMFPSDEGRRRNHQQEVDLSPAQKSDAAKMSSLPLVHTTSLFINFHCSEDAALLLMHLQ